jgi:hypothetical protein
MDFRDENLDNSTLNSTNPCSTGGYDWGLSRREFIVAGALLGTSAIAGSAEAVSLETPPIPSTMYLFS